MGLYNRWPFVMMVFTLPNVFKVYPYCQTYPCSIPLEGYMMLRLSTYQWMDIWLFLQYVSPVWTMLWLTFPEDHSDCCVENKPQRGKSETRRKAGKFSQGSRWGLSVPHTLKSQKWPCADVFFYSLLLKFSLYLFLFLIITTIPSLHFCQHIGSHV